MNWGVNLHFRLFCYFDIYIQLLGGRGVGSGLNSFYLPKNPTKSKYFKDITNDKMKRFSKYRSYTDLRNNNEYEFHPGEKGENGWRGRDHYHWKNPKSKNDKDKYLDKNGIPVGKNSKESHLIPGKYNNKGRRYDY